MSLRHCYAAKPDEIRQTLASSEIESGGWAVAVGRGPRGKRRELVDLTAPKQVLRLLEASPDFRELTFQLLGPVGLITSKLRSHRIEDGVRDAPFERRDLVRQVVQ